MLVRAVVESWLEYQHMICDLWGSKEYRNGMEAHRDQDPGHILSI